jgi:LytS/YehU family sensor histidine kinase
VAPHFLFNTLANVRVLVESGAPQAPQLLDSLIAYLRAAVPRLDGAETDLAQELALTRAYLKLMQMRIPDRLQFSIEAEESVLDQRCPPMSLLTLVENAVRHGIDPSEEGGAIDIRIRGDTRQVSIRVCDSGIGLQAGSRGLGTGLSSLRERLRLVFGEAAQLRLSEVEPHGLLAEISLPRQSVAAV